MLRSRLFLGLAALVLGGVSFAAFVPFSPFQEEMPQATEQHDMLLKGVGNWEGTITMHMPDMGPMAAPCTESVTAIGELWTVSRFESSFMGTPFIGASTNGYDVAKGKFVGSWIDSMTTSMTLMEGEHDAAKGALVMNYRGLDMASGEEVDMRLESVCGENSYTAKFFAIDAEGERIQMEIEMKRKAKAVEAGAGK